MADINASDVAEIVEVLDLKYVTHVGHSNGGVICLKITH